VGVLGERAIESTLSVHVPTADMYVRTGIIRACVCDSSLACDTVDCCGYCSFSPPPPLVVQPSLLCIMHSLPVPVHSLPPVPPRPADAYMPSATIVAMAKLLAKRVAHAVALKQPEASSSKTLPTPVGATPANSTAAAPFATIHVRRGDVLVPHAWPMPTIYYGHSHSELRLATSPMVVSQTIHNMSLAHSPLLLFTNEVNRSLFDGVLVVVVVDSRQARQQGRPARRGHALCWWVAGSCALFGGRGMLLRCHDRYHRHLVAIVAASIVFGPSASSPPWPHGRLQPPHVPGCLLLPAGQSTHVRMHPRAVLKLEFPLLFTEDDLLAFMPTGLPSLSFTDSYSRYFLFEQVVAYARQQGGKHVCTVHPKMGVPCNQTLVRLLPQYAGCNSTLCPWICDLATGACLQDLAWTDEAVALDEKVRVWAGGDNGGCLYFLVVADNCQTSVSF
jgi:hypothetical protein